MDVELNKEQDDHIDLFVLNQICYKFRVQRSWLVGNDFKIKQDLVCVPIAWYMIFMLVRFFIISISRLHV